MASKKELRALITLAGKIDPSLSTALMKASGENAKLSKELKNTNKQFKNGRKLGAKFGEMLKASFIGNLAANAVSNLASSVKSFTMEALDLSSSLIEVQNVVDKTFGSSSREIDKWAKTVTDNFGLSELQAKQWAGSMGAILKSSNIADSDILAMTKNLVGLAGDFVSFYNLDHDTAWEKIRSGIAGETEPLKQLGINMSVANLQNYAMSKGIEKSWNEMSQAEQTLLRYNYIMAQTTDAQGDFANSLDTSWENQKRLLKNNILQKLSNALVKFMPLLTELTKKANTFVNNIDFDKAFSLVYLGFKSIGSAIKFVSNNSEILLPLLIGTLSIMGGFKILSTVNALMAIWKASTLAQTIAQHGLNAALTANPIGLIIVAIGALIAIGVYLYRNWDKVKAGAISLWKTLVEKFNNIVKVGKQFFYMLISLFIISINYIKNNWINFFNFIRDIWNSKVVPFFSGIGEWFANIWDGIVNGFKLAWNGITNWFSNLWNNIINMFKGYVNVYIRIFNFLINAINKINFKVPDFVPVIGGKTIGVSLQTIPEFANGGIATQASIFGEAGPEMAIPLKRTTRSFQLLNQTAKILGVKEKSHGTIVNINIHGGDIEEVRRTVIEVLREFKEDDERVSFA